jgi:hypothetical protein
MNKEQFAIYEKTPQHGKDYNGVILAPFNTKEEAEIAGKKYGYYGDNYYVDILDYNKKSKIINKEQQELLNEAYKNYVFTSEWFPIAGVGRGLIGTKANSDEIMTQGLFINKCKTNPDFSKKWGLKIEERELSLEERTELAKGKVVPLLGSKDDSYNEAGIPKQSITVTYNDKTIESYY